MPDLKAFRQQYRDHARREAGLAESSGSFPQISSSPNGWMGLLIDAPTLHHCGSLLIPAVPFVDSA
jgi:hypothetical protein